MTSGLGVFFYDSSIELSVNLFDVYYLYNSGKSATQSYFH